MGLQALDAKFNFRCGIDVSKRFRRLIRIWVNIIIAKDRAVVNLVGVSVFFLSFFQSERVLVLDAVDARFLIGLQHSVAEVVRVKND